MIERTNYIEKLLGWKDEQVIKVVTGIRRCGKSTLLRQYQDALRQRGVSEDVARSPESIYALEPVRYISVFSLT